MNNKSVLFNTIKYLIIAMILIALQDALSTHIYRSIALPDIITCVIILLLFHVHSETLPWLFIFAGLIGIIEAVSMSQRIGLLSMYYIIITYFYEFFRSISQSNIEYLLMIVCALIIKYIIYLILGFVFSMDSILTFLFSMEVLYHFLATVIFAIIIFIPLNLLLHKRKER